LIEKSIIALFPNCSHFSVAVVADREEDTLHLFLNGRTSKEIPKQLKIGRSSSRG
jgi:DNA-binding CsgD family transcriptional regulator